MAIYVSISINFIYICYYITLKTQNKSIYLCGDYNLDLLKHDTQTGTTNFLDIMYIFGLYPLIVKPSRISNVCTTLIDNIFTSEVVNYISSGLIVTHVSEHLPVFA